MVLIIDGVKLAAKRENKLKERLMILFRHGEMLQLVSLVMKNDEAGRLYSRLKQEAAERLGLIFREKVIEKPEEIKVITDFLEKLNQDDQVTGIMIQRPGVSWGERQFKTRERFETWWQKLVGKIESKKDVDGLTKNSPFVPATIKAVESLIDNFGDVGIENYRLVVVGSRGLVGRGLVKRLKAKGFLVKGIDLSEAIGKATAAADVLISATGQPGLITERMVKPGAVVIDVGFPKGDVRFGEVKHKALAITPVPGGVGPLTVISLLENLVEAEYSS